jgi:hypothetical protein
MVRAALQRHRVALGAGAVLVALALVLGTSFAFVPEDVESGRVALTPECHFKRLFGHECLTCGLTRGFMAMSHGRVADAFRYNRGAPFLYAMGWAGVAAAMRVLAGSLRAKEMRS